MTTLKDAQAKAREIGMTITSRPEDGEYVVNFNRRFSLPDGQQFGDEDSAYHTTDLDDALATAKAMADHARNSARRVER